MSKQPTTAERWYADKRVGGLWRFAIAISILNALGNTVLGFEQAWLSPIISLSTAYSMELIIETIEAWAARRPARFRGSVRNFMEFLLPAHITALAVSMLIYTNETFAGIAFASATAIASKSIFLSPARVHGNVTFQARRHFFNPSNFGISLTLILFPQIGIAPPYQFTENVRGPLDVLLPLVILMTGTLLNTKFTGRLPLIAAWLSSFVLQALFRAWMNGTPWQAGVAPVTGLAFLLFTFYMVTDPGTTPSRRWAQIVFGASVAILYGLLVQNHIAFGLFFSLFIVTAFRGLIIYGVAFASVFRLGRLPAKTESGTAIVS